MALNELWVPVQVANPIVLCAFRSSENAFPTVNVIRQPGPYTKPFAGFKAGLELSYQQVGLRDASVTSLTEYGQETGKIFQAELVYSDKETKMKAGLLVYSEPDNHFILTFLDKESSFEKDRPVFLSLADSILFSEQDQQPTTIPQDKTLYLIGLLTIAALIVALRKRLSSQFKNHTSNR